MEREVSNWKIGIHSCFGHRKKGRLLENLHLIMRERAIKRRMMRITCRFSIKNVRKAHFVLK
ncbi:MAG: hypothetical protein K0R28_2591 [Paenibacillus sp.]|nr:hypothetical protein [Paenibacillus sp.]